MNRGLLFGIVASLAVLAASGVVMVAMMVAMADGHMGGMFGSRGSDPADEAPVAGVTDVRIEDFAFAPANIVVEAGTTVTWTNEDGVVHTVTSDGGGELDSPPLGEGETYRYTFDTPGAFAYYCRPHAYMKGLVTVR